MNTHWVRNGLLVALIGVGSTATGQTWVETAQLTSPSGGSGPGLALDGDRLVTGGYVTGAPGAVRILEWTGSNWSQAALIPGPPNRQSFGLRLSLVDDTLLVSDWTDEGAVGVGLEPTAYIYERTSSGWMQVQELQHQGGAPGDWFGTSVLLSGDEAFVGANKDNNQDGAVYVFKKNAGGAFLQTQKLLPDPTPHYQNMSHWGMSRDGDVLAVSGGGVAYIFENVQGTWTKTASLSSPSGPTTGFGLAVAVANGRAFVSAMNADSQGVAHNGEVYVYEKVGGTWTKTATVAPVSKAFGTSLVAQGDDLFVGASDDPTDPGAVYAFKNVLGQWILQQKLKSSSTTDHLGIRLVAYGNRLAAQESFPVNTTHVFDLCVGGAQALTYGAGKPGFYGIPQLTSDLPKLGATSTISLSNAFTGLGVLCAGFQPDSLPFDGGTFLVQPFTTVTFIIPFGGVPTFPVPIPVHAGLCGFNVYFQALIVDGTASGFYHTAQTPGLHWVIGS